MNNPFSRVFPTVDTSQLPQDIQYQRPRVTLAIILLFLVTVVVSILMAPLFQGLILTGISFGFMYYFLYKYNKILEAVYMEEQ